MKVKLDFVTNSSSSSYVCEVCGSTESGWDMGLSDAEMQECVNGHIVCTSHASYVAEESEEEYPYEVPSRFCPICTMEHIRDSDMLDYLLKMADRLMPSSREALADEIRRTHCNLEELRRWCNEG